MMVPNPTIRNTLLVLLTMTSGCVDAISFLALGQVFTAAMTGNTVLFGLAVAHTGGLTAMGYAVALFGFVFGAATGALLLRRYQSTTGWVPMVTVAICIEWAALVLFEVVISISSAQTALTQGVSALLIAILAYAMGVQGVTARRIGVNGVTTTVITSTLTGLVESVVWKATPTPALASSRSGAPAKATVPLVSIAMWILVIVFYGVGAAMCGGLELHWHLQAIWLPIAIVTLVIATAVGSRLFAASDRKTELSM